MISQNALNHAEKCRFCFMCRHLCPVQLQTGREINTPRAKGLVLSMVSKGAEVYDKDMAKTMYECLLCDACAAAPRRPVWVRLQEQKGGLAVAISADGAFADAALLGEIKECTKLHGGSLVHCEQTLVFTCGQAEEPPAGVRLYCCPTEEDLLQDTLSPIWSVFYAGLHAAFAREEDQKKSGSEGLESSSVEADSSTETGAGADKL